MQLVARLLFPCQRLKIPMIFVGVFEKFTKHVIVFMEDLEGGMRIGIKGHPRLESPRNPAAALRYVMI